MTAGFKQAHKFALLGVVDLVSEDVTKSLNVSGGMLKEGMSEPAVFQRFPDSKVVLEKGVLSDTIAVMVDLSPFSAFVAGASALVVRGFLHGYYQKIVPLLERAGGVVEKYIGDAVVALFGAPFCGPTTADDVYDAFEVGREIVTYIEREFGGELRAKVAITRGELFLGYVGPQSHSELTAVGTPLTTLFRLEGIARPNDVVLLRTLYDQISSRLRVVQASSFSRGDWQVNMRDVDLRGVGVGKQKVTTWRLITAETES